MREGQTGTAPDGTRVVVRNGQIVPLDAGPPSTGRSGPKARSDWGPGAVELPDGSVVRYGPRGGTTILKKGMPEVDPDAPPKLREFEINAAGRATLMDEGQRAYMQAVQAGYDPGTFGNQAARAIEDAPIPGGDWLANVIRDDPAEKANAAMLQFTDGALRTTSGAAAPEPEVKRARRAYFRQPGENAAVEPDRERVRERFRQTAIRAAGAAYLPPERVASQRPAAAGPNAAKLQAAAARAVPPTRQAALLREAAVAIRRGAPKDAVIARLRANGVEYKGP